MRRTIALFTAMAMMVLVAASVALAATVSCPLPTSDNVYCKGTIGDDTITGTERTYWDPDGIEFYSWGDKIYGYEGNDNIGARGGPDKLNGGPGNDKLYGGEGNDRSEGGPGNDWMYDESTSSNDTYSVRADEHYDNVRDGGGTGDIVDLSTLDRTQYRITWVDTSADTDTRRDALRIEQKGIVFSLSKNAVIINNYFDNKGGTGRGAGAIETIKFKGGVSLGFPAPQG